MSQLKVNSIVPAGGIPAGASGGGIIQIVENVITASYSYTLNTTQSDTALTVSITPRSSNSKILVIVNMTCTENSGAGGQFFGLKRGSTQIVNPQRTNSYGFVNVNALSNGQNNIGNNNFMYLDSPATTSSTTYTVTVWGVTGTTTMYINRSQDNNASGRSHIYAMEISG
jgi:hypothetical protein